MTRDMGRNMLPAVKTENDFSDFYLAVSASVNENSENCFRYGPKYAASIIYGCAYSQIKIRKIGDKNFSIFTGWQHISAHLSRVMGVIPAEYAVFGSVINAIIYGCAYSQIKIRKIGDKKFSVFTAGSIFRPISRVMGVINEIGFR